MKAQRTMALLALAIAFAPVIAWYGQRLGDGGGEPLGLIALALAIVFGMKDRHAPSPRLAEIALVIYAISFFFLPPLLRIIPALATIAFLTGMHRRAGHFGLLLLSLPVQASLDFFLGYPFRIITAEGSRLLINLVGQPVERLGVQLSLNGTIVSVDPPCSGLQMLWASAFLTALLATLFRLSYRKSLVLALAALALCLTANTLRAAVLFFPEAGLISLPGFAHEGIGLVFFALAALSLTALARKFHLRQACPGIQHPPITRRFAALACGVSLVTLLPAQSRLPSEISELPPLISYQGIPVEEVPLSAREKAFAKNFPGHLKVYRIENGTLILRRINQASRMLHPSSHCLQAEGFFISKTSLETGPNGRVFLQYHAARGAEKFLVTENIYNLDRTRHWAEVSAWYWHAFLNPQSGPWEAETLILPIQSFDL